MTHTLKDILKGEYFKMKPKKLLQFTTKPQNFIGKIQVQINYKYCAFIGLIPYTNLMRMLLMWWATSAAGMPNFSSCPDLRHPGRRRPSCRDSRPEGWSPPRVDPLTGPTSRTYLDGADQIVESDTILPCVPKACLIWYVGLVLGLNQFYQLHPNMLLTSWSGQKWPENIHLITVSK